MNTPTPEDMQAGNRYLNECLQPVYQAVSARHRDLPIPPVRFELTFLEPLAGKAIPPSPAPRGGVATRLATEVPIRIDALPISSVELDEAAENLFGLVMHELCHCVDWIRRAGRSGNHADLFHGYQARLGMETRGLKRGQQFACNPLTATARAEYAADITMLQDRLSHLDYWDDEPDSAAGSTEAIWAAAGRKAAGAKGTTK